MIELNKIYNEDNLITMGNMVDSSVDFILTSPPYNIRLNFRSKNGEYKKRGDSTRNKYLEYDDCLDMTEYYSFIKKCILEMLRVTKNYVFFNIQLLTGNKSALFKIIGDFSENIKEIIIWDKCSAEPAALDGVLNSEYEFIIVFSKIGVQVRQFQDIMFGRGSQSNIIRVKKEINNYAEHHTAIMPLKLARKIILAFTKEGDLVYDPFIGMGTTAMACVKEKRNWIGSEISKVYSLLAKKKIDSYLSQTQLF